MTTDRKSSQPAGTTGSWLRGLWALVCAVAIAAGLSPGLAHAARLVDIVTATKPSVVAVGTYNPLANPRFTFRGTGFVVGNGRQVVTNRHVLPGGEEVVSNNRLVVAVPRAPDELPDLRDATVAATDPEHDLALLQIDGAALPALALPSGELPREGLDIAFIGFPLGAALGLSPVTHHGIVSAVTAIALPAPTSRQLSGRVLQRLRQGPFKILQLDATAYPGNSGSPVFNAETGELLGVVNLVLVKSTRESALSSPTGITYAVPAVHVRDLIEAAGK
jgi:serine protease Do